jgi:Zn-dependent M28 family amino/carboxypeptidase
MITPSKSIFSFFFFLFFSAAYCQSIDGKKVLSDLEFLSSDELKGRKTLSEGSIKARKYIQSEFDRMGLKTQYNDYIQNFTFANRRENKKYEDAANVVGFVSGTSSRKIIVITAHYDHVGVGRKDSNNDSIYNGADDNASGTAALLALAEYFSKNQPLHPIMFAALDGEELGLQGAKALLKDFPFPLESILININMDMISRNEKGELYASGTHYYPELKPILEQAAAGLQPTLKFGHDKPNFGRENWTQSSDQGPFFDEKIKHIYFGVEDHKDYHRPSDEFKNIDPDFYTNAVNLILKCTLALDEKLPKE